jgi:quinol monooxygenase YgiN
MVTGAHGNVSGPGGTTKGTAVFVVTRFRATGDDAEALAAAVTPLLAALGARPGFRDGELGRSADDPELWALVTRWDGVGSYRRALSAAEVKITGAPVWVHALDEPGVYLPSDDVTEE